MLNYHKTDLPLGQMQAPPGTSGDPGSLVPGPQSSSPFVTSTSEQDLRRNGLVTFEIQLGNLDMLPNISAVPEFVIASPLSCLSFQLYVAVIARHILEEEWGQQQQQKTTTTTATTTTTTTENNDTWGNVTRWLWLNLASCVSHSAEPLGMSCHREDWVQLVFVSFWLGFQGETGDNPPFPHYGTFCFLNLAHLPRRLPRNYQI